MKGLTTLFLLVLIGLVISEDISVFNYHELIGIPLAAKVKAKEESAFRVAGGNLVFTGEIPHKAGIVTILTNGLSTICGASVISNTRLLTAAHCWWDGVNQGLMLTAVLGSNTIYFGGVRIATAEVWLHPQFDPTLSAENDVGIIPIPWVDFNDVIQPIALPSGELLNYNFAGTVARASGFGMLADDMSGIGTNNFLYAINLPIITNEECSRYFLGVVDSMMCASGVRGSTCRGDHGGPLDIESNGERVLIGISSFTSIQGCTLGRPAGFTRVSAHVDWIRSQL